MLFIFFTALLLITEASSSFNLIMNFEYAFFSHDFSNLCASNSVSTARFCKFRRIFPPILDGWGHNFVHSLLFCILLHVLITRKLWTFIYGVPIINKRWYARCGVYRLFWHSHIECFFIFAPVAFTGQNNCTVLSYTRTCATVSVQS